MEDEACTLGSNIVDIDPLVSKYKIGTFPLVSHSILLASKIGFCHALVPAHSKWETEKTLPSVPRVRT